MGKINSRQKGKRGELAACKAWREEGWEARRSQQFCGRNGDAADILVENLPANLHIEVKAVERLNIDDALDQASRDASPGSTPIVMHKKNFTSWKVTLSFEDFCGLLRGDLLDE
tara:strand:- start:3753 stop:4094 length:342 start_codon:yes stop_codon:yes gene_type:complete